MSFRDSNNIPIYPGAYYFNYGSNFGNAGNGSLIFPIYGSLSNYDIPYNSGDADNFYLVLPGFKIVVYINSNYGGDSSTCDNTSGSQIKKYQLNSHPDQGSSCRLYYNNIELSNVYDNTNYAV